MDNMIKSVFWAFFIGLLAPAQVFAVQKCNDLILILDPKGHDGEQTLGLDAGGFAEAGTMTTGLVDALREKVAPIIATTNLVENLCAWMRDKDHVKIFEEIMPIIASKDLEKVEKKLDERAQQIFKASRELCPDRELHNVKEDLLRLVMTNFRGNDWCGYTHKKAGLVLLIPKKYIQGRLDRSVKIIDYQSPECLKVCGFNADELDAIPNLSLDGLLQAIEAHSIHHASSEVESAHTASEETVNALISMFIHTKSRSKLLESPFKELSEVPGWNIYLTGHGGAVSREKTYDRMNILSNIKYHKEQLEKSQSGNKVDDWEIKYNQEQLKEQKKELSELQDEAVIPETGQIAGIDYNDFLKLMEFFNHGIQTLFVYYTTCFAGGYNQAFLNAALKKLNVDYIVCAEGVSEIYSYHGLPNAVLKLNKSGSALELGSTPLSNFFTSLREFFCEPQNFARKKGANRDPIAVILKSIVAEKMEENNQPFVRLPHIGVFGALQVDKKVKILTKVQAQAHIFEKSSIDYSTDGSGQPEAIIVYPNRVQVPLIIGEHTSLISPTPQEILDPSQQVRVIHIFEDLTVQGKLSSFICNLLLYNNSYAKIKFVIKKLRCNDYENSGLGIGNDHPLELENVIVQLTGKGDAELEIAFTRKDGSEKMTYQCSAVVERKGWVDRQSIAEQCDKLVMKVRVNITKGFVGKILEPQDLAGLQEPIDLVTIIQKLDKKVKKTFDVKEPGALKKILSQGSVIIKEQVAKKVLK